MAEFDQLQDQLIKYVANGGDLSLFICKYKNIFDISPIADQLIDIGIRGKDKIEHQIIDILFFEAKFTVNSLQLLTDIMHVFQ